MQADGSIEWMDVPNNAETGNTVTNKRRKAVT